MLEEERTDWKRFKEEKEYAVGDIACYFEEDGEIGFFKCQVDSADTGTRLAMVRVVSRRSGATAAGEAFEVPFWRMRSVE